LEAPLKERFCATCGGPLAPGAAWCDYCQRLSLASWRPSSRPAPSPAEAALGLGGKLLLALVGGLFGFALVAVNGLLGLLGVLLLYAIGLGVGAALDSRRPGLALGALRGPAESELPHRVASLTLPASLRYGGYLRMARRAVTQIDQMIRAGAIPSRSTLADLPRRAAALELRIRELARIGESIRRYLATHGRIEAEARERNLRLRLRVTQDGVARSHFEQALRALGEENAVYDRMRATLERVEGQIAHAAYTLSCTQSKVTAFAAGPDVSGISGDALARDLDALTRELAAFDDALNEVLGLGGRPRSSEVDEEPI
jgi:hypothetical protein